MATTDATGEGDGVSDEAHDRHDGMTVNEAAKVLGISEGAVRKRVERGKLEHERTPDGRLIVRLDTSATSRDRVRDRSHDTTTWNPERYVRNLEDQVQYLREQLDAERQARTEEQRRHDTILAQLTSMIPQLETPSSQEPSEATQTGADATDRGDVPGDHREAQEAQEARLWGLRVWELRIIVVLIAAGSVSALLALLVAVLPP